MEYFGRRPSLIHKVLNVRPHFARVVLKEHLSNRLTNCLVSAGNPNTSCPKLGKVIKASKNRVVLIVVIFCFVFFLTFHKTSLHLPEDLTFCAKI